MTIRMTHPEHGATHAYGENDAKYHEARGWVREGAAKPVEDVAPVATAEMSVAPEPEKKKPGRKPKAA